MPQAQPAAETRTRRQIQFTVTAFLKPSYVKPPHGFVRQCIRPVRGQMRRKLRNRGYAHRRKPGTEGEVLPDTIAMTVRQYSAERSLCIIFSGAKTCALAQSHPFVHAPSNDSTRSDDNGSRKYLGRRKRRRAASFCRGILLRADRGSRLGPRHHAPFTTSKPTNSTKDTGPFGTRI